MTVFLKVWFLLGTPASLDNTDKQPVTSPATAASDSRVRTHRTTITTSDNYDDHIMPINIQATRTNLNIVVEQGTQCIAVKASFSRRIHTKKSIVRLDYVDEQSS